MMNEESRAAYKLFLGPTVPTLLTTRFPNGKVNVGPCSWIQKVSYDPPLIVISQKPGNDTLANIRRDPVFGVSVPPIGFAQDALLCGQKPPFGESELELEGVRFSIDESQAVPLLKPSVQMAVCRAIDEKVVGDHVLVTAEVVEVWVQEDEFQLQGTALYWDRKVFARLGEKIEVEGY